MNNMLSLEEVKNYLEIEQREIEKFIQQNKLHAYKIGGVYLRFRKEEVLTLRHELAPKRKQGKKTKRSLVSRAADFWRFHNVYILTLFLFILLTIFLVQE